MRLDCDILSQRSIPPPPKVGSKNGKLEATTKNENMKQTENWYMKRAKTKQLYSGSSKICFPSYRFSVPDRGAWFNFVVFLKRWVINNELAAYK